MSNQSNGKGDLKENDKDIVKDVKNVDDINEIALPDEFKGLEVRTVDGFQGRFIAYDLYPIFDHCHPPFFSFFIL